MPMIRRASAPTVSTCSAALQRGIHQYLQILVGRARIEGITLEGSATPLVQ
ncbi:hypothetical protein ACL58G_17335 [Massilia sp. GER05]|uniref:hypothetical protein n=1 Tax=Massilia sp. GER05 TaxID=3394605 RepID=UPI003F84B645